MSKLQVDTIVDKEDVSAPTLSKGAIVTGVTTSTSFAGALTGDVTGNITGNQSGGSVNATTGDFSSKVTVSTDVNVSGTSTVGVLTATSAVVGSAVTSNADGIVAAGIVTAGTCFKTGDGVFGAGIGATITGAGDAVFAGVCTATTFVGALTGNASGSSGSCTGNAAGLTGNPNIAITNLDTSGTLVEAFSSTTTAWSTTNDLNITNGNLQFCSANLAGTNNTLDIISTTGINTDLSLGQAINVTAITAVNASTAYVNQITIDGIAVTENWVGGSAPTDGGSSGYDTYSFNILKTGNETFIVIANQVKTS